MPHWLASLVSAFLHNTVYIAPFQFNRAFSTPAQSCGVYSMILEPVLPPACKIEPVYSSPFVSSTRSTPSVALNSICLRLRCYLALFSARAVLSVSTGLDNS